MFKKLVAAALFAAGLTSTIYSYNLPTKKIIVVEEIPIITPTPTPEVTEVEPETEYELISLGEFKLTAYCGCKKCCGKWADNRPVDEDGKEIVYGAIGKRLTANYSIAVDPKVIPYGSIVVINGHEYEAMDCGGGIKGNRIDVYFDDHDEARHFAVQTTEVFIKEAANEDETL